MAEEEADRGYLTQLVSNNNLTTKKASALKTVMRSKQWKKLSEQWEKMQKEVEKQFSKPVKMKVFAYNDKMEKDTVMSTV